jgi:hypothetical protein
MNPDQDVLGGRAWHVYYKRVCDVGAALLAVTEATKDSEAFDDVSLEAGATLAAFLENFPLLVPSVS